MIARPVFARTNVAAMKATAFFLIAALLTGCARVADPIPPPPGMPLDPEHMPVADDQAITRNFSS